MTPEFSSPERYIGLPITTASDVYSLGVVLFHLLAGPESYRTRLDSTQDAIRDVCETEPLRPSIAAAETKESGRSAALPDRDLDDITLRALRKEPEKRYGPSRNCLKTCAVTSRACRSSPGATGSPIAPGNSGGGIDCHSPPPRSSRPRCSPAC